MRIPELRNDVGIERGPALTVYLTLGSIRRMPLQGQSVACDDIDPHVCKTCIAGVKRTAVLTNMRSILSDPRLLEKVQG